MNQRPTVRESPPSPSLGRIRRARLVIVNNQQDFVYNAGKGATDEASRLTFDQSWEQSGLFDIEQDYPRDLIGYGRNRPRPVWPGEARVAVQFVINYEEGGENCVLHGDAASEAFLSEIVGAQAHPGVRHMNMESIYEYGSRAGFWRLHRLFAERRIPVTVFGVALALARNPAAVAAMQEAGWEIASHGYRWIDYQWVAEPVEREHIAKAVEIHTRVTGNRPL